ncbi:Transcription factor BYE1 [Candida viswanathii]|uniref:Transcription factor BYE1 n=1 Tax=Candida viswanathii TaxID=5486 RepID=A0A367YGU4_9ASCO|nr:Transcription factor BYE1 [Candida viswanathii]
MEETRQRPIRANRGEKLKRYLEEEQAISSYHLKKQRKQHEEELDSNGETGEQHQDPEENEKDDVTYNDGDHDENDDEEEAYKENTDEDEVRCVPCGARTENYNEAEDTLGDMVQCDKCKTWQHARCMGYRTKKSIPDVHKCDVCTGKPVTPIRPRGRPKTKKEEPPKKDNGMGTLKEDNRISTAKAFYNYFKKRFMNRGEGEFKALDTLTDEQKDAKANHLAKEIEQLIFETYKGEPYLNEGRRILFVLRKHFMNEIVEGTVTFKDVLHKTPQEINEDIAKIEQQNRENIKNIILTENDNSQIIRRTHKGDIIKENEFAQASTIDESMAARKVDHRKFSEDIVNPGHLISHTTAESNSYQNLNPRIVDEDSDNERDDREGDGEDDGSNKRSASKSTESLSDIDSGKNLGNGEDDDDDDLLPFLSGGEDSYENIPFEKPRVWTGRITFPDFATFNALAKFHSCTGESSKDKDMVVRVSKEILKFPEYVIEGKLDRRVADEYLDKVINSRDLYIVEIANNDHVNEAQYKRLYNFLLHKDKVGVLGVKLSFIKDSYLMVIDFRDKKLPAYLQPHRKELAIGLYAVFVVQRDYTPGAHLRDAAYRPREHTPVVPRYRPPPRPKSKLPVPVPQPQTTGSESNQPTSNQLDDILNLLK